MSSSTGARARSSEELGASVCQSGEDVWWWWWVLTDAEKTQESVWTRR